MANFRRENQCSLTHFSAFFLVFTLTLMCFKNFPCVKFSSFFTLPFLMAFRWNISKLLSFNPFLNCFFQCTNVCYTRFFPLYSLGEDFHWYRLDDNGKWSHKMSTWLAPTNRDSANEPITDPRIAQKPPGKDFQFVSFMKVDRQTVNAVGSLDCQRVLQRMAMMNLLDRQTI